jgi:PERQ amino acid-rich with GYF domain-containing protein
MLGTDLVGGQDQLPALLDRLNVGRQDPFAFGSAGSFRQPDNFLHSQQVSSMLQDRAQLQQEQEDFDKANEDDPFDQQAREERLRQFHALRAQEGELGMRTSDGLPTHPAASSQQLESDVGADMEEAAKQLSDSVTDNEPLTLSQQVQKAASAQRQQQEQEQSHAPAESVWGKVDSAMPQPFPPPPSASPLPAPTAQRNRQNVAESLATGSRSQTQTPIDAAPTSVAPWAKEANDLPKGPSLKEIQEAEARTAAQREELAAAARRAQFLAEQERLSQQQAQAAPGLPSSANWASAGSPATPASTGSPWASKTQPAPAVNTAKKTLAQIQKEEEARKNRAAAAAAAAMAATPSPPAPPSAGKRYADLASKGPASAAPAAPAPSGAWTTVGASGKVKGAPPTPLGPRSASGTVPISPVIAKPRPVTAARTVTVGSVPQSNPNQAVEEFTKWATLALGKGLNSNING